MFLTIAAILVQGALPELDEGSAVGMDGKREARLVAESHDETVPYFRSQHRSQKA